ncbi:MAG: phospholipid carrier-dependent glycosyltransferase, partial [Candidatus Andersenbacteria bacterium]|nr:phospholipid carrier-dependent glycosyltransferase [Candidatus Andersenbacteria bacterium]
MDKKYLYILLIFVIALGLRLWGAGSFMTVDEENWMVRSAGFYHEMAAGNPGGTFLTTHPGATAMWLIGGGEVLQEKRVGMQVASDNLIYFRKAAVLPMVLATSFLIGLAVWLLDKKWGLTVSVTAGLLLAADPYLVGMSQIAHLDALQSLLMLDSLLAWLVYWQRKKYLYVAAAGILAGLALGTKMVLAFWLWPVFLLIAVAAMGKNISKSWLGVVAALGTVTGMAVLVLFIIWPALWVKADVSSSITRDISTVITDEHVALEAGSDPIAPITFYGRTWLGRVTPYNQILALGTLVAIFILWRKRRMTPDVLWLWFYALGYLLLVTYAAKKGDRYALPALVVMPALAGWTAAIAAQALGQRIKSPRVRAGMAAVAVMAVVAVPLLWSPYAIAYSNEFFPNIRPLSQQGWG